MSQSSISLKLDTLGGLSSIPSLQTLICSRSDLGKVTKIIRETAFPLSHLPKLVFFIYILAAVLMFVFLTSAISLAVAKSNTAVGLVIMSPILLVIMGALGGHSEQRWTKAEIIMAKKILKNTEGRVTLEKGYTRRCGGEMKKGGGVCLFAHRHYLIFATENTQYEIRRGEIYRQNETDLVCVISPFQRTNFSGYKLSRPKIDIESLNLINKIKYAEDKDQGGIYNNMEKAWGNESEGSSSSRMVKNMPHSMYKEDYDSDVVYSGKSAHKKDSTFDDHSQPSNLLSATHQGSNPYLFPNEEKSEPSREFAQEKISSKQTDPDAYRAKKSSKVSLGLFENNDSNSEDNPGDPSPVPRHQRKFSEGYIDAEEYWSKDPPYKV